MKYYFLIYRILYSLVFKNREKEKFLELLDACAWTRRGAHAPLERERKRGR